MKDLNTLVEFLIANKNVKVNVTINNTDLITNVTGIDIYDNGTAKLYNDKDCFVININYITHVGIDVI